MYETNKGRKGNITMYQTGNECNNYMNEQKDLHNT